ncbi:MAG: DUF3040 domain-containing protein [Mycobacteriales bacterium]
MPLSDHEQRLLEQIEQALYAEDPKFASTVRATDLRTVTRRRVFRAVVLFIVGLVVLVAGVVKPQLVLGVPITGVLGFCIMFGAAIYGVTQYKRISGRTDLKVAGSATPGAAPRRTRSGRGSRRSGAARGSLLTRMEERFRRRFDQR